ncbi:hypothetical protein N1037_07760 [Phaeobacter sp. G2]|nr:hypothetical protein N1037_07760 [Phaeobacter sp. G2]
MEQTLEQALALGIPQVSAQEGRSRVLSCDVVAPSPPVGELLARAFDHYGDQPACALVIGCCRPAP